MPPDQLGRLLGNGLPAKKTGLFLRVNPDHVQPLIEVPQRFGHLPGQQSCQGIRDAGRPVCLLKGAQGLIAVCRRRFNLKLSNRLAAPRKVSIGAIPSRSIGLLG